VHPDPAFREDDDDAIMRAVAIGFAHLFVATSAGPMVAHVPITPAGTALRFHVSRHNRISPYLDGADALMSVVGANGYVSPSWYPEPGNQVPTWNYDAIELEGTLRALDQAALTEQLDALAAEHEPRVAPARPWHRDKMASAVFDRMLAGIVGFELRPDTVRVTRKLSQNKPQSVREGVIAGLIASGNPALAEVMRV
jgi:transcriptional regulator